MGVPKIVPYRGYGNHSKVYITGMVMEDKGLAKPQDKQKVWQNILAAIKRFSSDKIAGVQVKVSFYGANKITHTDEFGFFSFEFDVDEVSADLFSKRWHTVHLELLDDVVDDQPQIFATGEIQVIPKGNGKIFVSDIDDTVLISHSTQTLKKLRLMLFKNAFARRPFQGVAAFYRALSKGENSDSQYPFFYVSSSEWNLYDLLEDFFHYRHLPKGTFLLKKLEYSIYKFWKSGGGNHEHKYEKIKSLVHFYSDKKFILFGDSGQRDPMIYRRLTEEFPGKIDCVYIRDIKRKKSLKHPVHHGKSDTIQTEFIHSNNTWEWVKHALKQGYVNKAEVKGLLSSHEVPVPKD